jgi:hypothetical protein
VSELVIGTHSMSFQDYLFCKKFELSTEIFYCDVYLLELHGVLRALGVSMFDFVERCHARAETTSDDLSGVYRTLESGVAGNLWDTREACEAHHRVPENLRRYAEREYENSLGTLKAIALLDDIEAVLQVAGRAAWECIEAAGKAGPQLREYVDDLVQFSLLRRRGVLDVETEPEGTFRFAFDEIERNGFAVDPERFRLPAPRRMRFWHDARQATEIRALCSAVPNAAIRARSFIYPATDPGVNPYLRRAAFS